MPKVSRSSLAQLLGLVSIVAGVVTAWKLLPVSEWLEQLQEHVKSMGSWAFVAYPFIMTVCSVFLLPGGVFAAAAGLLFGLWVGTIIVLAGNIVGAAIAFFLSRRFGRRWLEKRFLSRPRWKAMDEAIDREGWKIIFFSQLHPLSPSSLLNYLYGVTRIRFRPCMLWIMLGQLPGIFLYVYLGTLAQMGLRSINGSTGAPGTAEYIVWGLGLVGTVGISLLLGRIALKVMAEAQRPAEVLARENEPPL